MLAQKMLPACEISEKSLETIAGYIFLAVVLFIVTRRD